MPSFVSPQMISPSLIGRAMSDVSFPQQGTYDTYGLTTRFKVTVGDNGTIHDLGGWASCKGLKIDFKVRQVQVGGDYRSSVLLPERLEYDRIVLERGIKTAESRKLQQWLQDVISKWMTPQADQQQDALPQGDAVTITLLDPTGKTDEITHWRLLGAFPVSWSGPSMSAGGSDAVATETLVLQHGGFEWPTR